MIIENGILNKIEEKDVIDGTVTIPEGVTEIGSLLIDKEDSIRSTFDLGGLDDLDNQEDEEKRFPKNIKRIIIPKTVIIIEKMAFMGLESLENVEFEEGIQLTDIGANAFNGCSSLSGIKIPETVTTIDVDAFRGCSSITNLTFPKDSTVIISESSFEKCDALEELYFLGKAKKCDNDKESGINIIAQNVEELIEFNQDTIGNLRKKLKALAIPEGVKEIADKTFMLNNKIIKIAMPDSIEIIGDWVFDNCKQLKDVKIPPNVKIIGQYAFHHCDSIKSVTIPSSVQEICRGAFRTCIQLNDLSIFEGVKKIDEYAFSGCFKLKKARLPKSYIYFGKYAFPDNCIIINCMPTKVQSTDDDGR